MPACKDDITSRDDSDVQADTPVGGTADIPDSSPADASPTDADTSATDTATPPTDTAPPDIADTTPDTTTNCPGGPTCSCTANTDCDNAVCLDTHEGKRCATTCVDTCPAGYTCAKLGQTDTTFYCVSKSLTLCAPCNKDADCQPQGGDALCLDYANEGRYCGAVCESDADCAKGYTCVEATGSSGKKAKQCRLEAGVCACSDWAVTQGATTTCQVTNPYGTCTAPRVCTAKGLEPCTAQTPALEVCNALDDDCNGNKDDLPKDATCSKRAFEDKGSKANCKADADCQTDGEACDKGGKCRVLIGACKGTPLCATNGTLICQGAATPKLETCDGEDNDCDGATDEGYVATLPGGATAAIGKPCGLGACAGGKVTCQNQDFAVCNTAFKAKAADPCDGVDNDCDGQTDENACDDGDACTKDVCDPKPAKCGHASAVDCDDGEVCTADSCDKLSGKCVHQHAAGKCSDGSACTEGDACAKGECVAGKALVCDDGKQCTDDSCDAGSKDKAGKGCVFLPRKGTCTDGDACTAGDVCDGAKCVGKKLECDDGNPCTDDSCDKQKGCATTANTKACTDSNACTVGDKCAEGTCKPGPAAKCDDGNPCTTDSCAPAKGCVVTFNTEPCDDGDKCTEKDTCAAGKCGGAAVTCKDQGPCLAVACDKAKGCVGLPRAGTCTDGDACTGTASAPDMCGAGKCVGGAVVTCDDGNPCTDDVCAKQDGCASTPNTKACTDSNACTVGDKCAEGACKPGKPQLFARTFGGAANDHPASVVAFPEGGYGVVGTTASAAVPGGKKTGKGDDCWLLRVDDQGSLQWSRTFGGGGHDRGRALAAMQDGGFVLAGSTNSSDLMGGQKTAGSSDYWVIRTDKSGTPLWSRTFGGKDLEDPRGAVALADGGVAVVGYAGSNKLPGGPKTAGSGDAWLVRLDKAGNIVTSRTYGGAGHDSAEAMSALSDGSLVIAGSSASSTLPGGVQTAGSNDAWLVRTNSSGHLLWNRTFGGSKSDGAGAVAVLHDGGFALAGSTASSDLPEGMKAAGGHDMWVLRTDSDGNLLWSQTFGGSNNDRATGVVALPDGGLGVAGYTSSADLPQHSKQGSHSDSWVLKLRSEGGPQWSRILGGSAHDNAVALVPTTGGGLAMLGNVASTTLPGGAKSAGGYDYWLVRMDAHGNSDCVASGMCFSKQPKQCDDGNACSLDACHPTKGCVHAPAVGACASGECTVGDHCDAGTCKAGSGPRLFDATRGAAGVHVVPARPRTRSDGRIFVPAVIAKGDGTGGAREIQVWSQTGKLESASPCTGAPADAAIQDVGFLPSTGLPWVVGFAHQPSGANLKRAWVAEVDGQGKAVSSMLVDFADPALGPLENWTEFVAIHSRGQYATAVGGGQTGAGNYTNRAIATGLVPGGKLAWKASLKGPTSKSLGSKDTASAVTVAGNGTSFVAGASEWPPKTWIAALSVDGSVKWNKVVGQGSPTTLQWVGATLGVSSGHHGSGASGWLHMVAPSGAITRTLALPAAPCLGRWFAASRSGKVVVVGRAPRNDGTSEQDACMATFSRLGILESWSRLQHPAKSAVQITGAELDDRGLVTIAMKETVSGWARLRLARSDPWGHTSCNAAGGCGGKSSADCADTNPCTADLCDAAHKGCWHKNLPDGSACGDGKKCAAGTCK